MLGLQKSRYLSDVLASWPLQEGSLNNLFSEFAHTVEIRFPDVIHLGFCSTWIKEEKYTNTIDDLLTFVG